MVPRLRESRLLTPGDGSQVHTVVSLPWCRNGLTNVPRECSTDCPSSENRRHLPFPVSHYFESPPPPPAPVRRPRRLAMHFCHVSKVEAFQICKAAGRWGGREGGREAKWAMDGTTTEGRRAPFPKAKGQSPRRRPRPRKEGRKEGGGNFK